MAHAALNLLRILAALLFMQHGGQKLFALFGAEAAVPAFSLMWVAGILEWWGGLLVAIGLFTRPVALLLAIQMMTAYILAHLPQGMVPIQNGGELALLFFAVFLYIAAHGGGAFSVDGWWAARKRGQVAD